MAELEFGKSVDEIEEPVLIPEGWRVFKLEDEPKVEENKAMRENPGSPEAGHNWLLRISVVDDEGMYNGRMFFLRLALPRPSDEENYSSRGQKLADAKMQRIVGFVEAFGGSVEGRKVNLGAGAMGQAYVLQQLNGLSGEPENAIDIFNQGFKKVDSGQGY